MGKAMNDNGADAALNYWTDADRLFVCSAQPTTYAEASATYALADVTMAGGDFTLANGDSSGRKVTVGAKTGLLIDVSGTPTHFALGKSGDSTLRYVTECSGGALTANGSNTCNTSSWKITIPDPT